MALRDRISSVISKPAPVAPRAPIEPGEQPRRPARILTPAAPIGLDATAVPAPSANRVAAALKRSAAASVAEVDDVGDDNRRFAKRKGRNSQGQILFPGITVPFNVLVRDTSSTGARLEMQADKFNQDATTDSLPNHFTLHLPLDRIQVECQSMWRRGSRIGVRFTSTVTVIPAPAPRPQIKGKK